MGRRRPRGIRCADASRQTAPRNERACRSCIVETFTPYRAESPARVRGCLMCTHFLGRFYAEHLLCGRDGGRRVVGVPREGCAFCQRQPLADDE
jgi:hypothetical protein